MKTNLKNLKADYELLIAKLVVISMILSLILFFTSCSKDESVTPQAPEIDTQTTKDETVAQSEYDEVLTISAEAVDSAVVGTETVTTLSVANCATVTIDTVAHIINVDFGDTGCTGVDGLTRSGQITINYIGYYREPGGSITISLDDYTVNDVAVSGQVTYVSVQRNENGNLEFSTSVSNGVLSYPDGYSISYESVKTRTWVSGEMTGDIFDDVFQITGKSNGISSTGVGFTSEITSPITIKTACWNDYIFYPVSGKKVITPEGLATRSIDYGDGSCDKDVVVSVGGFEYKVTLP